jgi:kynurenine formamidase
MRQNRSSRQTAGTSGPPGHVREHDNAETPLKAPAANTRSVHMQLQHSITDDLLVGSQSQQKLLRSALATVSRDGFGKELWVFPLDAGTNVMAHRASDVIICSGGIYPLPHECAMSIEALEKYEYDNDGFLIPENSMVVFSVGSSVLELDESVATFLHVHRKVAAIATASRCLVGEGNRSTLPCPVVFSTRSEFGYLPLKQYASGPDDVRKFLTAKVAIVLPLHYGVLSQKRLPASVVTLDKDVRFVRDCTQQLTERSGYLKGKAYTAFPGRLCCPAANAMASNPGVMVCSCDWGSHVDSPSHFYDPAAGARTISDLTGQELCAPAVIVDISARVRQLAAQRSDSDSESNSNSNRSSGDDDVELTVQDLLDWESENQRTIPNGAMVCLKSGWSERFNLGDDQYNNFDPVDKETMHFPGFSLAAARWLVENRRIAGLAVDTLSTDVGASSDFPVHQLILGRSMFNVENLDFGGLSNQQLSPSLHLIVAPVKVKGAPEAPCRCIAVEIL